MTEFTSDEETEWEQGTWLAEGELYLYPDTVTIGGHNVFCVAMVGGDVYLGSPDDMKMHKLEIAKGMTITKQAVTAIRPKLATKQGQGNAADSRPSDDN